MVLYKKGVLRNFAKFTGKHLRQSLWACNFIKKDSLTQVFSCEFCEISKNRIFYRTPQVAVFLFLRHFENLSTMFCPIQQFQLQLMVPLQANFIGQCLYERKLFQILLRKTLHFTLSKHLIH